VRCGTSDVRSLYVGDVNLMGDNIDTIRKTQKLIIDASKEVGL
jgi:hypothetical protein